MQYAFLIYRDEEAFAKMTQEEFSAMGRDYAALVQEASTRGIMSGGGQLQPASTATTLRVRNSQKLITDGPFAETKEQFTGYFILQCKDLNEALALAERMPTAAYGSIEIRPLLER